MSEKDFEPLTSQLGIAGTSYRLQLGLINNKWASRLMKGKGVVDSYIYENVEGDMPNANLVVSWVLRTVAIPNINPHQIMKTTQYIMRQARENKEKKKVIAPLQEAKEIELEKVPESELKRIQTQGWVKEEAQHLSEREKFLQRTKDKVKAQQQESEKPLNIQEELPEIIKTEKILPKIPSQESTEDEPIKQPTSGKVFCPFCGFQVKHCPNCGKEFKDYN